jgi:hypothetical protein
VSAAANSQSASWQGNVMACQQSESAVDLGLVWVPLAVIVEKLKSS